MKDVGFIVCFLLTVYVYSYIQLLAASVFIKFSVSVSRVLVEFQFSRAKFMQSLELVSIIPHEHYRI